MLRDWLLQTIRLAGALRCINDRGLRCLRHGQGRPTGRATTRPASSSLTYLSGPTDTDRPTAIAISLSGAFWHIVNSVVRAPCSAALRWVPRPATRPARLNRSYSLRTTGGPLGTLDSATAWR